jgi:putative N6-adenine-specific DNA methylase
MLDSSETLHRRDTVYRSRYCSINVLLAEERIMLSEGCNSDFIDPMCGSGTIVIEAALIAYGIPPGVVRQNFGFENWLDFDDSLLQGIYNDDSMERDFNHRIIGRDISRRAIESALQNLKGAGLQKKVDIQASSIFDYIPSVGNGGIVVTNPPYGERLSKDQIESFYTQLGDCFKQKYNGYDVWLISSNMDALKNIGLRPSRKISIYNGSQENFFEHFSRFNGKPRMTEREHPKTNLLVRIRESNLLNERAI